MHTATDCNCWALLLCPLISQSELHTSAGRDGQSFHVVCPSLPGYGFSEAPKAPGYGCPKFADMFDQLMRALGYDTYLAHGELHVGSLQPWQP